jgi:ribose transport system substrate-binding protein
MTRRVLSLISLIALTTAALAVPQARADAAGSEAVAQAREALTKWPGPTTSPSAQKGKTVYVVTCSSQGIGCVRAGNGVKEAGELLGWTVRVVDGKGDPGTWNGAIQSAIAAGANGIVLDAVPPALVGDALDKAKKANVTIVSVFNPIPDAQSPVFAFVRPDHVAQGRLMADWVATDSGGKGQIVLVEDREFPELRQRVIGFESEIAKCGGCKIVGRVDSTIGTMAQRLPGAVSAELNRDGSVTYLIAQYDSSAFFTTEGVRQAGKTGAVKVAGYEGDPQTIDAIRNGTQAATIADPAEWMGWQAVDELNRAFAGTPPANTPVAYRLIDKGNAPDTKGWLGDVDFRAEFRRLWGVH